MAELRLPWILDLDDVALNAALPLKLRPVALARLDATAAARGLSRPTAYRELVDEFLEDHRR